MFVILAFYCSLSLFEVTD